MTSEDDCSELLKSADSARQNWRNQHRGCKLIELPVEHGPACEVACEQYQKALDAWYDQCRDDGRRDATRDHRVAALDEALG